MRYNVQLFLFQSVLDDVLLISRISTHKTGTVQEAGIVYFLFPLLLSECSLRLLIADYSLKHAESCEFSNLYFMCIRLPLIVFSCPCWMLSEQRLCEILKTVSTTASFCLLSSVRSHDKLPVLWVGVGVYGVG